MTAIFSEDGLSYTNQISLGISDGGSIAWGVPDAVVIPDGRIRIYWVDESSGMSSSHISLSQSGSVGSEQPFMKTITVRRLNAKDNPLFIFIKY